MTVVKRFSRVSVLVWLSAVVFSGGRVSASPGPSSFLIRYWLTTDEETDGSIGET